MLIVAILTNLGVLPKTGSIYLTSLTIFITKMSTPLLLLDADLRRILKHSRSLIPSFFLGTVGTLLGSTLGYLLFGNFIQSSEKIGMLAALTAKNIGGGVNYFSVADTVKLSSASIALSLSVDNILGLIYFPTISILAGSDSKTNRNSDTNKLSNQTKKKINAKIRNTEDKKLDDGNVNALDGKKAVEEGDQSAKTFNSLVSLCIAFSVVALSEQIHNYIPQCPPMILITAFTLFLSTVCNKWVKPFVRESTNLGHLLLMLFFGCVGNSAGNIGQALTSGDAFAVMGFVVTLYVTHIVFILFIGKQLLKYPLRNLLVASNANIGNPATALALANSKGWTELLMPSVLIGTLGNAIGTFLGLLFYQLLLQTH